MLELGLVMAFFGFEWLFASIMLGMWRGGALFDVPEICTFINLGIWVGGGPIFGIGFWLTVIGGVTQLVQYL
ncbi:MAG: hypothetical protein Q8P01_04415 [bacterium]|nr:hypothetical protein [bacterium]